MAEPAVSHCNSGWPQTKANCPVKLYLSWIIAQPLTKPRGFTQPHNNEPSGRRNCEGGGRGHSREMPLGSGATTSPEEQLANGIFVPVLSSKHRGCQRWTRLNLKGTTFNGTPQVGGVFAHICKWWITIYLLLQFLQTCKIVIKILHTLILGSYTDWPILSHYVSIMISSYQDGNFDIFCSKPVCPLS